MQVVGRSSAHSLSDIASAAGLSVSLLSLIFNRKRPITAYAAARLATALGISIDDLFTPGVITVKTPPARPLGRIVGRIHRDSTY